MIGLPAKLWRWMMSDEFKVGDIVICTGGTGLRVKIGTIDRVTFVDWYDAKHSDDGEAGVGIDLLNNSAQAHGAESWCSNAFRLLPKADDTFINQMRSLKPAKEMTNVR